MTYAFGGPEEYHGKDMWAAHEKLVRQQGLNDHHFDVIVKHLVEALQDAGVPEVLVLDLLCKYFVIRFSVPQSTKQSPTSNSCCYLCSENPN